MPVQLVFHGGLHLLEKDKRKQIVIELKEGSSLHKVLEEIGFPVDESWFAVTGNKLLNLSDILKGDEVIDFFEPVIGG